MLERHVLPTRRACWLQRYAATTDEAPHNYPATHFGRYPPPSTIQSRRRKRRGLELAPDPMGSKIPHCRKLRLARGAGRSNLPQRRLQEQPLEELKNDNFPADDASRKSSVEARCGLVVASRDLFHWDLKDHACLVILNCQLQVAATPVPRTAIPGGRTQCSSI
jgi:hypothetical protein